MRGVRRALMVGDDAGMATAEYALVTVATVGPLRRTIAP